MSLSTDKMKKEIKDDLCLLLKIPSCDNDNTISKLIDKIILCAVIESISTISKITALGKGTITPRI